MWTLPGGGLEFGESPDAAAVRELYEETGLDGKADSLAFVSSQTGPPGQERGRPYGPYHAIRIVYRIAIMGGELAHETNGSTDGARWFTRSDASQLPLLALAQAGLDHLGGE